MRVLVIIGMLFGRSLAVRQIHRENEVTPRTATAGDLRCLGM